MTDRIASGARATGLERLLAPVQPFAHIPEGTDTPGAEPTWLRLGDWHVFASPRTTSGGPFIDALAELAPLHRSTSQTKIAHSVIQPPFDLDEAYRNYLAETWTHAADNRRLSPRQLALYYRIKRFVPRSTQLRARRVAVRWQGTPAFPRWPLDDSVERLLNVYASWALSASGRNELEFRWFWPEPYRAALILTHDVETPEGVRLVVELADLEEELGFRSSFNFGAWYDVDPGVMRELTGRGFEIGMHGIVHDRSLFSSRRAFESQLPGLRRLAKHLGAVGFRSPATHRVFDWLSELPIEYDCTIPHSDPYEPQPGGCCSLWPFFVGNVVELPYTLPQDHTLLTLLGHRSPDLWLATAFEIEQRFGLIQCISHPDPGYLGDSLKRAIYVEFLRGMRDRTQVWRALARDVAAWWRLRSTAAVVAPMMTIGIARRFSDSSVEILKLSARPANTPEAGPNPDSALTTP